VDIKRILCPVDFSDASAHAIDQAVVIAGWYKARITALHVCSPMLLSTPGLGASGRNEAADDAETARLRNETAAHCEAATSAGIGLDLLVDIGQPASHILGRAQSLPADMIVMGTHGTSGFAHLVLGSVTEKVLRKATCPVLTVPPRAQATSRLPFRRVLSVVDFSDWSLSALQFAFSLAQESNAGLTLLHVIEWPWHEPPPPPVGELAPAQALALAEYRRYSEQSAMARLKSLVPEATPGSRPTTTRISHGKPYVEILRIAAEAQVDLIVIGVHGRNPLDLNLFGSTANQVVRRAVCPVLTLRR
jgi:nucleotide-binding universal stress UspA family protein